VLSDVAAVLIDLGASSSAIVLVMATTAALAVP
jgi:hypothetical protein